MLGVRAFISCSAFHGGDEVQEVKGLAGEVAEWGVDPIWGLVKPVIFALPPSYSASTLPSTGHLLIEQNQQYTMSVQEVPWELVVQGLMLCGCICGVIC